MQKIPLKTYAAIAATMIFWASAFVGIRAGVHGGYSPGALALFRYMVASIVMGVFYFKQKRRNKIRSRDIPLILLVGICGIGIYNIALNYGEITTTAATASFVVAQTPVCVIILAILFLGERLSWRSLIGIGISILGIIVIADGERKKMLFDAGVWYVVLATIVGSCYTAFQKPLLKRFTTIEATTFAMWAGTLSMMYYLPSVCRDIVTAPISSTLTIIYLGIFPAAIAYLCWTYVLSHLPATRTATYQYFLPLITTFMGWILLSESPTLVTLVGGLIALSGTIFVTQKRLRDRNKRKYVPENKN